MHRRRTHSPWSGHTPQRIRTQRPRPGSARTLHTCGDVPTITLVDLCLTRLPPTRSEAPAIRPARLRWGEVTARSTQADAVGPPDTPAKIKSLFELASECPARLRDLSRSSFTRCLAIAASSPAQPAASHDIQMREVLDNTVRDNSQGPTPAVGVHRPRRRGRRMDAQPVHRCHHMGGLPEVTLSLPSWREDRDSRGSWESWRRSDGSLTGAPEFP